MKLTVGFLAFLLLGSAVPLPLHADNDSLEFYPAPEDDSSLQTHFKAGTGLRFAKGSTVLLEIGSDLIKAPDDASPNTSIGTEDRILVLAHIDGKIGLAQLSSVGADGVGADHEQKTFGLPYFDIQFVPLAERIRLSDGKKNAIDDTGDSEEIEAALAPLDLGHDGELDQRLRVRAAAVGVNGRFESLRNKNLKAFARFAATLLGGKSIAAEPNSNMPSFEGLHVAGLEAGGGLIQSLKKSLVLRVFVGGDADFNWDFLHGRTQSDQKVFGRLSIEKAQLFTFYVQAGESSDWEHTNISQRVSGPETMVGAFFFF